MKQTAVYRDWWPLAAVVAFFLLLGGLTMLLRLVIE